MPAQHRPATPTSDRRTAHARVWRRGNSFVVGLAPFLKKDWRDGRLARPGGRGRPPLHKNPPLRRNRGNFCSARLLFFSHGGELCCIQPHGDDKKNLRGTEVIWAARSFELLFVMCLWGV